MKKSRVSSRVVALVLSSLTSLVNVGAMRNDCEEEPMDAVIIDENAVPADTLVSDGRNENEKCIEEPQYHIANNMNPIQDDEYNRQSQKLDYLHDIYREKVRKMNTYELGNELDELRGLQDSLLKGDNLGDYPGLYYNDIAQRLDVVRNRMEQLGKENNMILSVSRSPNLVHHQNESVYERQNSNFVQEVSGANQGDLEIIQEEDQSEEGLGGSRIVDYSANSQPEDSDVNNQLNQGSNNLKDSANYSIGSSVQNLGLNYNDTSRPLLASNNLEQRNMLTLSPDDPEYDGPIINDISELLNVDLGSVTVNEFIPSESTETAILENGKVANENANNVPTGVVQDINERAEYNQVENEPLVSGTLNSSVPAEEDYSPYTDYVTSEFVQTRNLGEAIVGTRLDEDINRIIGNIYGSGNDHVLMKLKVGGTIVGATVTDVAKCHVYFFIDIFKLYQEIYQLLSQWNKMLPCVLDTIANLVHNRSRLSGKVKVNPFISYFYDGCRESSFSQCVTNYYNSYKW